MKMKTRKDSPQVRKKRHKKKLVENLHFSSISKGALSFIFYLPFFLSLQDDGVYSHCQWSPGKGGQKHMVD